jgi:tetratricopeptide (TPR) repeat protein
VAQSLALAGLEIEQNEAEQALTHLREAVSRANEHIERHIEDITLLASRIDAEGLRNKALELITEIGRQVIEQKIEAEPPVFIAYVNAVAELGRPLDEIISAIGEVRELQPRIELELTGVATITLSRHERIDDAVALSDHWFGVDRPLDEREAGLLQWRLGQTALRDEPDRAINLLRRAHETDVYKSIGFLNARPIAGEPTYNPLAESLYRMSGEFSIQGYELSHERLLEEALRVDPTHPMANNDLGYSLADRNERLEDAESMLVTAIKASPSDSAVLDSLGWVRYKLGKLENPGNEAREIHEDAAIPLLEEAALLRKRDGRSVIEDDPVILDHLGDAYWRAGRTEEAVGVWERAAQAYDEQLQMTIAAVGDEDGQAAVEYFKQYYGEIVAGARAKAAAAKVGEEPAVAPSPALDKNQP